MIGYVVLRIQKQHQRQLAHHQIAKCGPTSSQNTHTGNGLHDPRHSKSKELRTVTYLRRFQQQFMLQSLRRDRTVVSPGREYDVRMIPQYINAALMICMWYVATQYVILCSPADPATSKFRMPNSYILVLSREMQ